MVGFLGYHTSKVVQIDCRVQKSGKAWQVSLWSEKSVHLKTRDCIEEEKLILLRSWNHLFFNKGGDVEPEEEREGERRDKME